MRIAGYDDGSAMDVQGPPVAAITSVEQYPDPTGHSRMLDPTHVQDKIFKKPDDNHETNGTRLFVSFSLVVRLGLCLARRFDSRCPNEIFDLEPSSPSNCLSF